MARLSVFSLPLFIDSNVFRDYGLPKIIPISIFGAHFIPEFYNWRAAATMEVQNLFPTLLYTHPGYGDAASHPFAVTGTHYAQLINQSWFSLADTTRLDYVVRKHLEIPASGAVLVAPDSPALKDYGFEDLHNCILGTGRDLYLKIDAVARNKAAYEAIRANGQALVRSRYRRESWTPIIDWLACRAKRAAGQVVVQDGALGGFRVMNGAATCPSVLTSPRDSQVSAILRAARDAILSGDGLDAAAERAAEAAGWLAHMGEPRFMLGVICLTRGDLANGIMLMGQRAGAQSLHGPSQGLFDPVELAWLLLGAYLFDQKELFKHLCSLAQGVRHLSLRRVWWFFAPRSDRDDAGLHEIHADDHVSIHWLGQESFDAWCGLVRRVLRANGKTEQALDLSPTAVETLGAIV